MPVIQLFVALLAMLCIAPSASAQSASAKGTATVTYSVRLSAKVKQDALQKAKVNALDRYFAASEPAKAKNLAAIREQLIAAIDSYILGVTVLAEELDEKGRIYTLTVRADIDGTKLDNALQSSAAVARPGGSEKSLVTFLFVARQQKSVQSFDERVTQGAEARVTGNVSANGRRQTSESERITGSSVGTADTIDVSGSTKVTANTTITTGGSNIKRADVIEWDVSRTSDINSVVTGTFTNAGFEVVEAEYLEQESNGKLSIDSVRKDYSSGDDLAAATLRDVVSGVRSVNIPYVALGTLDVGVKDSDPATGLTRVYVTVSGKVLDVTGRFPKTVSAVGPVQFAGLGPNETVARTNALKEAAQNAAQQLMNELNAKGVR
jgi:hypothetical protein